MIQRYSMTRYDITLHMRVRILLKTAVVLVQIPLNFLQNTNCIHCMYILYTCHRIHSWKNYGKRTEGKYTGKSHVESTRNEKRKPQRDPTCGTWYDATLVTRAVPKHYSYDSSPPPAQMYVIQIW